MTPPPRPEHLTDEVHEHPVTDRGVTLIELILAISLVTIVMTAVSTAVIVLVKNQAVVQTRVGEAHDVRQLVNYLPYDVGGTRDVDVAFGGVEGFDPAAPTACEIPGEAGTLHLALGPSDGLRRVEYRSTVTGSSRTLTRWTCAAGADTRRVRIADHLDPTQPVSVRWVDGGELLEMTLHHSVIGDTALSASPFVADAVLPDPAPPGPGDGDVVTECPPNPNAFTRGFTVMTSGEVTFANQGESYGPIAVGGDLRFKNASVGTHTGGTFVAPGEAQPTSVLVRGMVHWPDSGGGYLDVENGYVHVGDIANWDPASGGPRNQLRLTATDGSQNKQIRVNDTDQEFASVERADLLDFDGTFGTFRSIATNLAGLPGSCEGITDLVLLGTNGVGDWSGGNLWLHFEPGYATTVTMSMAEYASIGNVNLAPGSATPTAATPLIITITDEVVTMPNGETNISRNHVPSVLWNFPNARSVTTGGVFWGSILAPNATVVQRADIRGNVIAAELDSRNGIITNQSFQGVFPWPTSNP